MQKAKTPNTGLQSKNNNLNLRNSKVCPYCHSGQIMYRKYKRNYTCRNCSEEFSEPIMKQVKDRRNELPLPPILRRLAERY